MLLTHIFDAPAGAIAELSSKQWEAELLFKWPKQDPRCKAFWGLLQRCKSGLEDGKGHFGETAFPGCLFLERDFLLEAVLSDQSFELHCVDSLESQGKGLWRFCSNLLGSFPFLGPNSVLNLKGEWPFWGSMGTFEA